MLRENGGKRLKQERKCEYKVTTLHVLINKIFSFFISVKCINKEAQLRDIECFQVQTNQQGCLTALMENLKGITTSLDNRIVIVNSKDWLLTRVYIDPPQLTKVRFSNLTHSKLEDSDTTVKISKPTVIPFNKVTFKHKWYNDLFVKGSCEDFQKMEKKIAISDKLLFLYLFFIQTYKKLNEYCDIAYEQILVYLYNNTTRRDYHSGGNDHTNCHKQIAYNEVTTTELVIKYVCKNLHIYTAMVNGLHNIEKSKVIKGRSTLWSGIENGGRNENNTSLVDLVSRYEIYTLRPITFATTNDLVDLNTSKISNKKQKIDF